MIAFIKGEVADMGDGYVVIENNGMGYMVNVPGSVLAKINGMGETIKLYTYMYIREDELSLYGFNSKDELSIFKLLISISGVGPKAASSILTVLDANSFRMAVLSGDEKAITKANGVGAKGAKRIIMELKDKISLDDMGNDGQSLDTTVGSDDSNITEAVMALVSLGYGNSEAMTAVRKVADAGSMDSGEIVKKALKNLI